MTGKEFLEFHRQTIEKMHEICAAKNQDYSGGADSFAFANFELTEIVGNTTTEQGFLVRMSDKYSRAVNVCKQSAAVKDESKEDTLLDLANYCILMAGYIKYKKRASKLGLVANRSFADISLSLKNMQDIVQKWNTVCNDCKNQIDGICIFNNCKYDHEKEQPDHFKPKN